MLLKKERDHILHRHSFIPIASKCRLRSVTRLAASRLRVPVVWVWWFKCLCCSVHTLAHVNRARCDSSALYWRRRVPTCCQISSPPRWLKCNGVCRGRGEVPSEKKKTSFCVIDRQQRAWNSLFNRSAASLQCWSSINTPCRSVCVQQEWERGERGIKSTYLLSFIPLTPSLMSLCATYVDPLCWAKIHEGPAYSESVLRSCHSSDCSRGLESAEAVSLFQFVHADKPSFTKLWHWSKLTAVIC